MLLRKRHAELQTYQRHGVTLVCFATCKKNWVSCWSECEQGQAALRAEDQHKHLHYNESLKSLKRNKDAEALLHISGH